MVKSSNCCKLKQTIAIIIDLLHCIVENNAALHVYFKINIIDGKKFIKTN